MAACFRDGDSFTAKTSDTYLLAIFRFTPIHILDVCYCRSRIITSPVGDILKVERVCRRSYACVYVRASIAQSV